MQAKNIEICIKKYGILELFLYVSVHHKEKKIVSYI